MWKKHFFTKRWDSTFRKGEVVCGAFPFLGELICHGQCSQCLFQMQSTAFISLSHSFIVSSNGSTFLDLKTSQQMIRHKSLHVDHSGQIRLCVKGIQDNHRKQKTHTPAATCAAIVVQILHSCIWYLELVLDPRFWFNLCSIWTKRVCSLPR